MARKAIAMGFSLSIAGPVTFPKAESLRDVVRQVPIEHLLIETDAPYLAPVPHRGTRNEPAYVARTIERVAAARVHERVLDDDEAAPGGGPAAVVVDDPLVDLPVGVGLPRPHGRHDDPVAQGEAGKRKRSQESGHEVPRS